MRLNEQIRIRKASRKDSAAIKRILKTTPEFNKGDFSVCMECLDSYYNRVPSYAFVCAESGSRMLGFICYDRAEIADDVFELYWVVVAKEARRMGVAKMLHDYFIKYAKGKGARAVFVETESESAYGKAQEFYKRCGYTEEARVKDFYGIGNDKIIYGLRL